MRRMFKKVIGVCSRFYDDRMMHTIFIDKFQDDWIDWLDSTLAQVRPAENLILLLDGAFIPGIHNAVRKARPGDSEVHRLFDFTGNDNEKAQNVSPMVIQYAPHHPVFKKVLTQFDGNPMVSAIITTETAEMLAARLAAWCLVECDGQTFNFRFPDTRRFPGIFKALTEKQRQELAGPARQWSYIGRNGFWQSIDINPSETPVAIAAKLNESQFAAIVEDSQADEILYVLQCQARQWPRQHSEVHATIVRAIAAAKVLDLEGSRLNSWCEACVDNGLEDDPVLASDACKAWASGENASSQY